MVPLFRYIPSGDSAFIIKTGDEISVSLNLTVRKLMTRIEAEKIPGVVDLIPSYNELLICYDPLITGFRRLLDNLHAQEADIDGISLPDSMLVHVPVLYGEDAGPDLGEVAEINHLSTEEVIGIHSSAEYIIYMLGFTPGFCYLGGMDERIATPRKSTPRLRIPAGSVGIADKQTGIYPVESPGGWQLIGLTPLKLFDSDRDPVFLFNPGDHLKFYPVKKDEFIQIQNDLNNGSLRLIKNRIT